MDHPQPENVLGGLWSTVALGPCPKSELLWTIAERRGFQPCHVNPVITLGSVVPVTLPSSFSVAIFMSSLVLSNITHTIRWWLYRWQCSWSVSHFRPDWNILTNIGYIAIKLGHPHRMDIGIDAIVTFYWIFIYLIKCGRDFYYFISRTASRVTFGSEANVYYLVKRLMFFT